MPKVANKHAGKKAVAVSTDDDDMPALDFVVDRRGNSPSTSSAHNTTTTTSAEPTIAPVSDILATSRAATKAAEAEAEQVRMASLTEHAGGIEIVPVPSVERYLQAGLKSNAPLDTNSKGNRRRIKPGALGAKGKGKRGQQQPLQQRGGGSARIRVSTGDHVAGIEDDSDDEALADYMENIMINRQLEVEGDSDDDDSDDDDEEKWMAQFHGPDDHGYQLTDSDDDDDDTDDSDDSSFEDSFSEDDSDAVFDDEYAWADQDERIYMRQRHQKMVGGGSQSAAAGGAGSSSSQTAQQNKAGSSKKKSTGKGKKHAIAGRSSVFTDIVDSIIALTRITTVTSDSVVMTPPIPKKLRGMLTGFCGRHRLRCKAQNSGALARVQIWVTQLPQPVPEGEDEDGLITAIRLEFQKQVGRTDRRGSRKFSSGPSDTMVYRSDKNNRGKTKRQEKLAREQHKGRQRRERDERDAPIRLKQGQIVGAHADPIEKSNMGHILLQKMGWAPGNSVGKRNDAIVSPIDAVFRSTKSGLGFGSGSGGGPSTNTRGTRELRPRKSDPSALSPMRDDFIFEHDTP